MAEKLKLEVKIISSDTIKPLSPTPTNRKTVTLSFVDQTFPPIYTPVLLVYNPPTTQTQPHVAVDIDGLRLSLSEILSIFSPFAGRCLNTSTVLCDDQGVPFIITNVNCFLSDVFNTSKEPEFVTKFVPDLSDSGSPITELVPLAFQINIFACGGVVIGCNMLHKLLDWTSFATFLNYWAGLSIKRDQDILVQPNFDTGLSAFPPSPKADLYCSITREKLLRFATSSVPVSVVAKRFVFPKEVINELKVKATSDQLPNPTRFEALAGFVWELAFKAARDAGSVPRDCLTTELSSTVNIRTRITPPLPKGSIGNLAFKAFVRTDGRQPSISYLSLEIHETISRSKDLDDKFKGEKGTDALIESMQAAVEKIINPNPAFYRITSMCNLGFNEADFGFGKPARLIPLRGKLSPLLRNFITFTDYANATDSGIEVWLLLEEKEMLILESDPCFLAFASPS